MEQTVQSLKDFVKEVRYNKDFQAVVKRHTCGVCSGRGSRSGDRGVCPGCDGEGFLISQKTLTGQP